MGVLGLIISLILIFLGAFIGYLYGIRREFDRISTAFRYYGYSIEEFEEIIDNYEKFIK